MTTIAKWLASAKPGHRLIYGRDDGEHRPDPAAMREARNLHVAGQVHLVQRREKSGAMAYIAQRVGGCAGKIVDAAPKPNPPPGSRDDRIVALLRKGKTYAEIGEDLGTSAPAAACATYAMRKAGRRVPAVRQGRPARQEGASMPRPVAASRAEDERILAALDRRSRGEPLKHIAARMGFLNGAVLGSLLAEVERETDASEGRVTAAPMRTSSGARLCAVPECGRTLYAGNTSGVCRSHNHAVGCCRCPKCAR